MIDILYTSFAGIKYWAYFATLYLFLLTYQDYKNNMMVDDRRNYLMMGITISLITHVPRPLWYIVFLALVLLLLGFFMRKTEAIGEADIKTLSWIFFGFGLINVFFLSTFAAIFVIMTFIYFSLKKYLLRTTQKTPFYIVIMLSFIVTSLMTSLY